MTPNGHFHSDLKPLTVFLCGPGDVEHAWEPLWGPGDMPGSLSGGLGTCLGASLGAWGHAWEPLWGPGEMLCLGASLGAWGHAWEPLWGPGDMPGSLSGGLGTCLGGSSLGADLSLGMPSNQCTYLTLNRIRHNRIVAGKGAISSHIRYQIDTNNSQYQASQGQQEK